MFLNLYILLTSACLSTAMAMPLTRSKNFAYKNSAKTSDTDNGSDKEQCEVSTDDKLNFLNNKVSEMAKDVTHIKSSITEFEAKFESLTKNLNKVKIQCDTNTSNLLKVNLSLDHLEQHTRRNNLRIFGIPEKPHECTDDIIINIIKSKLNIDLNLADIERSHIGSKGQYSGCTKANHC